MDPGGCQATSEVTKTDPSHATILSIRGHNYRKHTRDKARARRQGQRARTEGGEAESHGGRKDRD